MTPIRMRGLGSSRDNERVVILLDAPEKRLRLSFSSDAHEAQRLAREMGQGRCRCNPVYDFIESMMNAFLATITRVVLEDAGNQGLAARVELRVPGRGLNVVLPCYPPDALALALRRGAPIYATPGALAHATAECVRGGHPWNPEIKHWLEGLTPGDF